VLSPKAVLEGRKTNRAPISLIIGLIVSGVCVFLATLVWMAHGGADGILVGSLLALPTFAVLTGLVLLINRLDPEPPLNLLLAAGWGCGVAVLAAFLVNSFGQAALTSLIGDNAASTLTGDLLAPMVEETCKGSLLLLLFLLRRNQAAKYIKNTTDALVYAALCGLGFAFAENILYYMTGLTNGDLLNMVLIRGVIAPLGHPLFTSMTALGFAYAATHRERNRSLAIVAGWVCAVCLHSLWNTSLDLGNFGILLSYPIDFVVLVLLISLLIRDRRRLVTEIRTYLPAYIPSRLVQPHDVEMLGSMPSRRQARRWARANAGIVGFRAMGDYQLAATELALLHSHAANGVIGPTQFLERQSQIVGLMRAAQDAFFRRRPQRTTVAPPSWAARHEQSGFFASPDSLQTTRLPTAKFGTPRTPPGGAPQPGNRPRPGHPPQGRPPSGPRPPATGADPRVRPPHAAPPRGAPPSGAPQAPRPPGWQSPPPRGPGQGPGQ
jgi:RsiW-degrading membrane proteinase PrsW (M82 family)